MSAKQTVDDAFTLYSTEPTPQNLNSVVKALKPTIDYQLASLGASTDPVMKNKALTYTAQAVKNFDPEKSSLPTFISSQLRRLSRDRRKLLSPVRVPERIQLESYDLYKKEQDYIDKHGREPDLGELSEFSGVDIKKINTLRSAMMPVSTEETFGEQSENTQPDYLSEATDYVYGEADHIDRKILELKTGYGGSKQSALKAIDIAQRLNISPSQVSRRSLRLSKRINELKEALES